MPSKVVAVAIDMGSEPWDTVTFTYRVSAESNRLGRDRDYFYRTIRDRIGRDRYWLQSVLIDPTEGDLMLAIDRAWDPWFWPSGQ
jgi:hypothetical protein